MSGIEVVHVGSASRDVTADDRRGWRLGGGVTYSALATARLGIRTAAVIGLDEEASGAHELGVLRAAGVEVLPVRLAEGPVFENVEQPGGRVQTCLATGQPLPVPDDRPEDWSAAAWSVVPVAGEIPDAWLAAVPAGARVALGWQGFLRRLAAGRRVERTEPRPMGWLSRASLVGVSRHDLDPELPLASVTALLAPGTDLIVTDGRHGGQYVRIGEAGVTATPYPPVPADHEADPTGAGDTFLAAVLASSLRPELRADTGVPLDLAFAAAAASLVVEGHGLAGVPTLTQVRERLAGHATPD